MSTNWMLDIVFLDCETKSNITRVKTPQPSQNLALSNIEYVAHVRRSLQLGEFENPYWQYDEKIENFNKEIT